MASAVIAETTSVDAQFTAEALDTTEQADALTANFIAGKTTINVSGDYLLASDGNQFDNLYAHMNAGDKIEVAIYRSGELLLTDSEGVFTSLSAAGANSDTPTTGAYSIEVDATMSAYGSVQNVSNCENSDYGTFANATPTGFDAISNGAAVHDAGTADEIVITDTKQYFIEFDMVLNSGTAPFVRLRQSIPAGNLSTPQVATAGSNAITLTATGSETGVVAFYNDSTATDFEITNLSVREVI